MQLPDAGVRQRPAVRPFDGFHRAATPRVFSDDPPAG